ncbi:MAG: hypothetical protein R3217_02435 [Gammaproteobacteria bacterium]|nr:hypothetical protein [Gammaproteobacteria bacterium]
MKHAFKILIAALCLAVSANGFAGQQEKKEEAKFMSPRTAKKLETVQEHFDKEEFNEALAVLRDLEESSKDNPYEQAVTLQWIGYVYVNMDEMEKALQYLERALRMNELPSSAESAVIYMVAQIYSQLEQYQKVIDLMLDWFKTAEDPPANAFLIVANAYSALEKWQPAYPYISKAVEKAERKTESWWQLKVTIEFKLDKFPEAAKTLEVLVAYWPKERYWRMLTGVYMELGQESKALSAISAGYEQGMITDESDILNLVRLYMMMEVPYQAGKILEKEIADERVEGTKKNFELLSTAWIQAREYEKGIDALGRAAALADDGELYLRQAQLYMNVIDHEGARVAAMKALEKGGLEDKQKGQAWLIRGSASAELKRFSDAEEAFNKARGYQETRRIATSWLEFIRTEQSVSQL